MKEDQPIINSFIGNSVSAIIAGIAVIIWNMIDGPLDIANGLSIVIAGFGLLISTFIVGLVLAVIKDRRKAGE